MSTSERFTWTVSFTRSQENFLKLGGFRRADKALQSFLVEQLPVGLWKFPRRVLFSIHLTWWVLDKFFMSKVLVQNLPCKVLGKEDFPSVIDILSFYVAKEDKLGETCERKLGVVKTTLSFYRKKATRKKKQESLIPSSDTEWVRNSKQLQGLT